MKVARGMRVLAILSLLGVLLAGAVVVSAKWDKVDVCHVTNVPEEGYGVIISIADPAWLVHEAHGDKEIGMGAVDDGDGKCHLQECPLEPVAVDDEVTTPVDTPVKINVLANDDYCDLVAVSVQVFPQYGILGIVEPGIFEYTPNTGFVGADSFVYRITDTGGQYDTATVTITVGP
jgi:hypothetical protein